MKNFILTIIGIIALVILGACIVALYAVLGLATGWIAAVIAGCSFGVSHTVACCIGTWFGTTVAMLTAYTQMKDMDILS